MYTKKAQLFSMDAIFSLMIFIGVFSFAAFVLVYSPEHDYMQERAENVADYLLMKKLGSGNMLDASLIDNFSSYSYSGMKSLIGVPENFYFRIVNMTSSTVGHGGLDPENATSVVNVRRIGVLDGNYVYLDTILWK